MNKLTIPAILVATVMVAGIFAFMPVEKASTVHTTITASTADIIQVVGTCSAADVSADCDLTVDIAATTPFTILGVRLAAGGTFTGNEDIGTGALVVNGDTTTIDPADDLTDTQDVVTPGGDFASVAVGAGTITADLTHVIGTGADTGDETVTVWVVLLIPGDATTPTMSFD